MKKERLMEIGLSEEQAEGVLSEYGKAVKGLVSVERLNEAAEAKKKLESDLADRDKQLEEFEKAKCNAEELSAKIKELQEQGRAAKEKYEADIKQLKIDSGVKAALTAAGAKNLKAAAALLEIGEVEFCEDGSIKGLDEQIKALIESDGYLFESRGANLKGERPGQSRDGLPTEKGIGQMTYSEMLKYDGEI